MEHAPRVMAADPTVLAHHSLPFDTRFAVPVLSLAAQFVHRVEAKIPARRNLRPETRRRGLALFRHFSFNLLVPFRGSRLQASLLQFRIKLHGGLIESQLDNGEIRRGGLEELVRPGMSRTPPGISKRGARAAKMD